VEKTLEAALRRNYATLLETTLKFIPFCLIQIFIYVHYYFYTIDPDGREELELNQYGKLTFDLKLGLLLKILPGIRAYTILWNMLTLSFTCVSYAAVYQNYTKALQFRDLREFGVAMNLTLASTGVRALIPFLDHFLSVCNFLSFTCFILFLTSF
jgi:hypothetical protein